MTQSLGTWGDPDSVTFHPFSFYGQTFHVRSPGIPQLVRMRRSARQAESALDVTDDMSDDDMDKALAVLGGMFAEFVADCLTPAEADRWRRLVADPTVLIDLRDLKSLAMKVASLAGEDDADPLDKSQPGSTSNGATSEGGSPSPDYTTDPIPTS